MVKIFNKRKYKKLRSKLRRESTPPEDKLWYKLRNKQLGYKFRRQHGIGDFIVDFFCPELKLIIEVDGKIHCESDIANYDQKRQRYLENLGLIVKRYSASEIFRNLNGVLRDIKEFCDKMSGEVRVVPSP